MQNGEPSVEEILESIKKVIAREHGAPGGGAGSGASGSRSGAGRAQSSSHLDHTADRVEPTMPEEADEVLELDEDAMLALAAEDAAEDAAWTRDEPARAEAADGAAADAPLTGEATASAMRDNFAALAMLAQPGRQPQIVRSGETSLEELTRELLRPMLATWLEENLPGMVEELVKAEIARIAGKKS